MEGNAGRSRWHSRKVAGVSIGEAVADLVILGAAGILLLLLAYRFLQNPDLVAPTKDPAWYTWRAKIILASDPGTLITKSGPLGFFSGGYRVMVPLLGALLVRVAGIDPSRFAIFLMVGIPVLSGLALAAFAEQHRRSPLLFFLTLVAAVGLYLTIPYIGYLDNVMGLYILAVALPFLEPARTSWGARSALALLLFMATLIHLTTTVFFVGVLVGAALLRLVMARFSVRTTLAADGPTVLSAAAGMFVAVAAWVVGVWGPTASLSEAVVTQPYPQSYFEGRLSEWFGSLKPRYTVPLILIAVGWILWRWFRREDRDLQSRFDWPTRVPILWLFPLLGVFGFVLGAVYPYYRFINTTLAPLLLVGIGLWLVGLGALWIGRKAGEAPGRALQAVVVVILLAGVAVFFYRPGYRFWNKQPPWISPQTQVATAAVAAYAEREPDRPIVILLQPPAEKFRAWGLAKQWANILLGGLPGDVAARTYFYVGDPDRWQARAPTVKGFPVFDRLSREFLQDAEAGLKALREDPVVFEMKLETDPMVLDVGQAGGPPQEYSGPTAVITSDVVVVGGTGMAAPSRPEVEAAQEAAGERRAAIEASPSRLSRPLHDLRVLAGLVLLLFVPGTIAMGWFGLSTFRTWLALAPGLSLSLVLLSAFVEVAVTRGPFGTVDAVASVVLSVAVAVVLAIVGRRRRSRPAEPDEIRRGETVPAEV